jgi:hypothetical protein
LAITLATFFVISNVVSNLAAGIVAGIVGLAIALLSWIIPLRNRVHSGVGGELRFCWPVQPAVAGSHGFPASAQVMASRAVRPWFAVESR